MGYTNTDQHQYQSSWADTCGNHYPMEGRCGSTSERVIDDTRTTPSLADLEKNMDQSISTARTHLTTIGIGDAHKEDDFEDDTTTIRSLDSITGGGLLSLAEEDEHTCHSSAQTLTMGSAHPSLLASVSPIARVGGEMISSVCSVSTAPSTDETASFGQDWIQFSHDNASRLPQQHQAYYQPQQQPQQRPQHRRVPSWEASPTAQFASHPTDRSNPSTLNLPPPFSPSGWATTGQHIASFRGEHSQNHTYQQSSRLNANSGQWFQSNPIAPRYGGVSDTAPPFTTSTGRGMMYRQSNSSPYQSHHHQRKPNGQSHLPPLATNTPPRSSISDRGGRTSSRIPVVVSSQSPHRTYPATPAGANGPRSSSEVLKTLLRKKACLYEPDTSRAVALVTWLVGRELALEYGFFSRQQLQAGVHACVASKINAGIITRTKVNRCMQIILNSCFHYIIPRPDGTEENGEAFRGLFLNEMKDNSFLLSVLPSPWNDIVIRKSEIIAACEADELETKASKTYNFETPHASPRFGSLPSPHSDGVQERVDKVPSSPSRDSVDGDSEGKRAVLLCFNENVRCAEDVFRCHNEFIRDTAHACHLQLSSTEWQLFFGCEAASTPYLWGNVGIPVPYLEGQDPQQTDALGVLTNEELSVLRTSWCSKRYDHNHDLCGFGHAEVNGGWLRRNPYIHDYDDELCPNVSTVPTNRGSALRNVVVVDECPHGVSCSHAHSLEEVMYHRRRYKQRNCQSVGKAGGCALGDACFAFHPIDSYRFPKKSDIRSPRHARSGSSQTNAAGKAISQVALPRGSPILFTGEAPIASFERHLHLPGLQSLFRKNSCVTRSSLLGSSDTNVCYYNPLD